MGRMSELHDDLGTIHRILLGQRKVAREERNHVYAKMQTTRTTMDLDIRVDTINDLLLEIEAAGVKWPDNVVALDTMTSPCDCSEWHTQGKCSKCKARTGPSMAQCSECHGQGRMRFIHGDCIHCGGLGKVQHD